MVTIFNPTCNPSIAPTKLNANNPAVLTTQEYAILKNILIGPAKIFPTTNKIIKKNILAKMVL